MLKVKFVYGNKYVLIDDVFYVYLFFIINFVKCLKFNIKSNYFVYYNWFKNC